MKLAQQLTFMEQQKAELEKQAQHYDQLKAKAKELQDSLDPTQKLRDKRGELDEMVKAGLSARHRLRWKWARCGSSYSGR